MKKKSKKYPFYFYLIALLVPILFFIILELFLNVFDYGNDIPQWVNPSQSHTNLLMLNPDINKRYFHSIKSPPSHNYDAFRVEKGKNTFRIFVMGGSTAAGFPYTVNGAFSRYIQIYLQKRNPEYNIEMVNIAMTAVNTYTLKDLLPGVIEQDPDLVLIYTGHNEYYGALGIGSTSHFGYSHYLVDMFMYLQTYRSVQLLNNIILNLKSIFVGSAGTNDSGTLMSRMVGEKSIPYKSDMFFQGINQFQINMSQILKMLNKNNIPVIIGALVSNLKDQNPFETVKDKTYPNADSIYQTANKEFSLKNYQAAYNFYLESKELDALRFRAPEKIDSVIQEYSKLYDFSIANIDSSFVVNSYAGIPGSNLFTDHVHPTIEGYNLMAKTFIKTMENTNILPEVQYRIATMDSLFKLVESEYPLTRLDSVQAALRIKVLKSGWPFKRGKKNIVPHLDYVPSDYIDSLAIDIIYEKISWEQAHYKAALWYKNNKNINMFVHEMNAIIYATPFNDAPYNMLISHLIQSNRLVMAYPYLNKWTKIRPNAFNFKWLGIYFLTQPNYVSAIECLEQSLEFQSQDAQTLYNLAGAYSKLRIYNKALSSISACLQINPNYPNAAIMKQELLEIVKN